MEGTSQLPTTAPTKVTKNQKSQNCLKRPASAQIMSSRGFSDLTGSQEESLKGVMSQILEKRIAEETALDVIVRLVSETCVKKEELEEGLEETVTLQKFTELEFNLKRLITTVNTDSIQITMLENRQKNLEFELDTLKNKLSHKAEQRETERIEDKFITYTPISKFISLENKLKNYAEDKKVAELQQKVDHIDQDLTTKATIEGSRADLDQLKSDIACVIQKLATKEDLKYEIQVQNAKLKAYIKSQEKNRNFKELKEKVLYFHQKLANYPTITDMNKKVKEVWKHFDKFCSYDHIINFRAEMEPRINTCETCVQEFGEELSKNKEILQRFDEVLLEKAPKFAIQEIYSQLEQYTTLSKLGQAVERVEDVIRNKELDLKLKIQELQDVTEKIQTNFSTNIGKIAISVENRVIHQIKRSFIDREELNSCLKLKAQKEDLKNLEATKSDKIVTNENIVALNLLFKQLELSVILTVECLKNLLPDPPRSDHLIHKRCDFLFKQANSLLKWINLKTPDQESENLLRKELEKAPYPFETESIIPSKNTEIINQGNQNNDFDISSFCYPKKEAQGSTYFKLDERVKSKLAKFARGYTTQKNYPKPKENADNSFRSLFINQSIVDSKLKVRESEESFNFKTKRSSQCHTREKFSSLDRSNPINNIQKLYDGCKTPVPSHARINLHSTQHAIEFSKAPPCTILKVPSCVSKSRKYKKTISGTDKNIRIKHSKF
ncbi:unnamed protein product [Moneuplotes crassus]|uniref:Uncharacterized protein n=1 Tax=Euplotes crassus TaxID=5936 RepID=A0AAD1YDA5_EUPCR|nr:unnamed protein product [Moneuplotes crassus]